MNIIFDNVIVLNTYSRFLLLFYLHRLIFGASSLAFCVILPWINIYSSSSSFIYTLTTTTTCTTARLFDGSTVGVINASIDKDSPKVATMDKLVAGDKKVYCRCWQSGTFPLCDASHMAHNKATGDNVGPLIVSVDKAE